MSEKIKPFKCQLSVLSAALLCVLASPSVLAQDIQYQFRKGVPGLSVATTPTEPSTVLSADLSATSLLFDPLEVGQSAEKSVVFINSGTGGLTLSPPATSGLGFTATTNCGPTLSIGQSCLATVTFAPTAPGSNSGTLSFGSDANNGPHQVTLQGTGLLATGTLDPASVTFGDVEVGQASSAPLVFTNTGNMPVSAYALVAGTGLTLTSNTCGTQAAPVSLAAGTSCGLTVRFAPSAEGALTGAQVQVRRTASVLATAPVSGQGVVLNVAGQGAFTDVASGNFGNVTVGSPSSIKTLVFSNTGSVPLTDVSASVTGDGYYFSSNTCGTPASPVTVAVGSTCSIGLRVTAPSMGLTTGTVTLASSAENSPLTRTFTANGTQAVGELTAQTSTDFGEVNINTSVTRNFTFRNVGNTTLYYPSVTVSGTRLSVSNNTCTSGSTVAANATCTFTVTYNPTSTGTLTSAYVRVDSNNAVNKPSQLTVTGSAVNRTATLQPNTTDNFGVLTAGGTNTRTYVFVNSGSSDVTGIEGSVTGTYMTRDGGTCGAPGAPSTLAAGANCTVVVRYSPTANSITVGSVSVSSSAVNSPHTSPVRGAAGSALYINGTTESNTASLNAGTGKLIRGVLFASYGNPTGTSPNFVVGTCHAPSSVTAVETAFVGKQSGSISVSNSTFGGDPCNGTAKKLSAVLVAY